VCGLPSEEGFREAPSGNFTAWAQCFAGDVMCPPCRAMLKDRRLRARSWLATPRGLLFRTPEGKEAFFEALLAEEARPAACYVTRGGQRQGYLSIVWRISLTPGSLWVGTDWLDGPVLLSQAWAREVAPLVLALRKRGASKRELLEGAGPWLWERALAEGWDDELRQAERLTGDPRWEVIVVAAP